MAKQETIKGKLVFFKPKENHLNGVKWVDDPEGDLTITKFKYNWFEKILIRLRLMRDRRYNSKYIVGIDPFETIQP